jgi:hypothetical protein
MNSLGWLEMNKIFHANKVSAIGVKWAVFSDEDEREKNNII